MSSHYQSSPNAAGRPTDNSAPAQPAPGQPTQGAPNGPPADGGGGGGGPFGGGMMMFLLPLVLILTMVLTSRSQSKKQKQLESSLKVGDQVLTNAGLIGKLVELGERTVKLEIAPGVNVKVLKSSVQGTDQPEGAKAADDKKSDDKVVAKDKPQEKKA